LSVHVTDATRCSRSHCPGAIGPDASPDCSGGSSLPFRAVPQREVRVSLMVVSVRRASPPATGHTQMGLSEPAGCRTTAHGSRDQQARDPRRYGQSDIRGIGCVQGEFVKLGHTIAGSSVWQILHAAGIDPAPRRTGPLPPLSAWFPAGAAALGLCARASHPGVVEEAPARHP